MPIFNDQSFNYSLTNDIISVEQPGPDDEAHVGHCQAKWCLRTCAKCLDLDSSHTCAVSSGHLVSIGTFYSVQYM